MATERFAGLRGHSPSPFSHLRDPAIPPHPPPSQLALPDQPPTHACRLLQSEVSGGLTHRSMTVGSETTLVPLTAAKAARARDALAKVSARLTLSLTRTLTLTLHP